MPALKTLKIKRTTSDASRLRITPKDGEPIILKGTPSKFFIGDGKTKGGKQVVSGEPTFPYVKSNSGKYLSTKSNKLQWTGRYYFNFTSAVVADYQCNIFDYVNVNSTNKNIIITLPDLPSNYDQVIVADPTGKANIHPITVKTEYTINKYNKEIIIDRPFSVMLFTFYMGDWVVDFGGKKEEIISNKQYISIWEFTTSPGVLTYKLVGDQFPSNDRNQYALYLNGKESLSFRVDKETNTLYLDAAPTTSQKGIFKIWITTPDRGIILDVDVKPGERFYFIKEPT